MVKESILSAIGNTPLVQLNRIISRSDLKVYAKLEALNPGGSVKDRAALNIIRRGLESGAIRPGTTVVESSSGNMGIGLAQACSYYGLRFICVVDAKTTTSNIRLMETYGAEVEVIDTPHPLTGEYLQARIERVQNLLRSIEGSFWPNQYANLYNPMAHYLTMHEIATALSGKVDYLFCAVSTCGTIRGCSEYIRERGLVTKVYAVDAVGSVIFGGKKAKRLIPGHGAAVRPQLYRADLSDECIQVTDVDCVIACRSLVRYEAILAGGSSGAVFSAFERVQGDLGAGATCVLIFPDRGERYLDTIYSDQWVLEHFAEMACLWKKTPTEKDESCAMVTC
jgi:N-(2-amino-2-carboxyethyl)-L-glutamate synthase